MRMSSNMFNESLKRVTDRAVTMVEGLRESMLQDGAPPGSAPVDERQQYDNLVRLFAQRDARVTESEEAWDDMQRLSEKFGAPPKGVLPGS